MNLSLMYSMSFLVPAYKVIYGRILDDGHHLDEAGGPKGTSWGLLTFWVSGVVCPGGCVEIQPTAYEVSISHMANVSMKSSFFFFFPVLAAFSF